jgi:hypothetical protein
MSFFQSMFGNSNNNLPTITQNQGGLFHQQINTANGNLLGTSPMWQAIHSQPFNILDITTQAKNINEKAIEYKKYQSQHELIENLSNVTIEILKIVNTIKTIEDYVILDKYIRDKLFNKSVEDFIDSEPKGSYNNERK